MNFALRDWLGNGKGRKRVLLSEDEKELDGDGGRGRGRGKSGGKVGERSKGYLHRVVFFQCFLFEPFVERLSRLIFGMMSMNYILYKTREYFKPRTNALSRCATRDAEPSIA